MPKWKNVKTKLPKLPKHLKGKKPRNRDELTGKFTPSYGDMEEYGYGVRNKSRGRM